jgi:hypothetical protein
MRTLFAAVALMAFGQAALATEPARTPLVLNDTQMDQVRAGAGKPGSHGRNEMRTGQISDAADPDPTINAGRRGMGSGGAS